jgi:hypothetical protein
MNPSPVYEAITSRNGKTLGRIAQNETQEKLTEKV